MVWEKKGATLSFLCWVSGQAWEGTVSGSASFSHQCDLCVREFVGECAPMWKSNGNPDPPSLPPEPWQRSAGHSQLTHQKCSNQTEMTEAISVAGKLHEKNEMFTQTWNRIEMKWSQMTPHTSFRSWLQSVLFRQGFMDLTGICQYDLQWCE